MTRERRSLAIDRATALHKMIRLVTYATCGQGYLNFMGNEFGHPEWIDFPREGNNWSYHYARRQWSLRDNKQLRYAPLADFDEAMMRVGEESAFVERGWPEKVYDHVTNQVLIFRRANLLFAFNFNPHSSFADVRFETAPGEYRMLLDSDAAEFDGHARVDSAQAYRTTSDAEGRSWLSIYLPTRTALVFEHLGVIRA